MQHAIPCEPVHLAGQELWEFHESDDLPMYQETGVPIEKKASPWLSEEIIKSIDNRIDELSPWLRELSLKIHGECVQFGSQHLLHMVSRSP